MGGDRSLDEFLDASDGVGEEADASSTPRDGTEAASPSTDDGSEPSGDDGSTGEPPGLDAGPADITMAFAPDGAPCEACGDRVERRWHDGNALVCGACKEW